MVEQSTPDLALMRQEFARREDVGREVDNVEGRLGNQIKDVKTDLEGDIRNVKTDLEKDIQQVKTDLEGDIQEVKTDLRWFIGIAVLLGGIIVNFVAPLLSKLLSP